MPRARFEVGVTIEPIGPPAEAVPWAAAAGFPAVQWSATRAGCRPRELGPSARREIRALLARHEVACAGIDAIVPAAHLADPAHADRALSAVVDACGLAADLGRVPVTVCLPGPDAGAVRADVVATIASTADRLGVRVADLAGAEGCPWPPVGVGIDPAASIADGRDPAGEATRAGARLVAARVVDLPGTGMRGPIGGGGPARLDPLGYRIALEVAGFRGTPVIDCRQWIDPAAGALASAAAWPRGVADS